ncbi:hypothetical protein EIN_118460 [Entamoeba invadens IP1]|uniref:Uncharacterized protein n=1 Tax=Entamoeba invadens IP1 TaxID=370355 RepID=L7FN12_ENTIV|nr:hypothetical protein EIN_118460 [Entamoeba invadens IP1]ELP92262.1 hypothetical protein EIN_118460 [Entamoeba invadens IP1]|eukprot:XP_004259033.1 hypothetical protein EIN_118460 [Entamoeba invadens IP1]
MYSMKKRSGKITYKERRSNHVLTEAVCIAAINQVAKIELCRPSRKTFVAQPFLPIVKIIFSQTDVVDFEQIVEKRILERFNFDLLNNVTEETALRRLKKNRTTESMQLLIDLSEENGVTFQCAHSSGKNNVMVIDYIQRMRFAGRTFELNELETKGKIIHEHISKLFVTRKKVVLEKCDKELVCILNQ